MTSTMLQIAKEDVTSFQIVLNMASLWPAHKERVVYIPIKYDQLVLYKLPLTPFTLYGHAKQMNTSIDVVGFGEEERRNCSNLHFPKKKIKCKTTHSLKESEREREREKRILPSLHQSNGLEVALEQ